jgi:hypothetical protein
VAVDPSGEFSYVTTSDQHSAPATQVIENLISPFRNHVVSIHTSWPANTLTCEPILKAFYERLTKQHSCSGEEYVFSLDFPFVNCSGTVRPEIHNPSGSSPTESYLPPLVNLKALHLGCAKGDRFSVTAGSLSGGQSQPLSRRCSQTILRGRAACRPVQLALRFSWFQ